MTQGLNPRLAAAILWHEILDDGAGLEEAFDKSCQSGLLKDETIQNRALCRAILTISIRQKGLIDTILAKHLKQKPSGIAYGIVSIALAQMFFMRVPAHASISIANESARANAPTRHLVSLINAVLRKIITSKGRVDSLMSKPGINLPAWLYSRWQRNYGSPTARDIAAANLIEPKLDISVKSDLNEWAERLQAETLPTGSLRLRNMAGKIDDLPGFAEGAWWVQDQAASIPATLLGDIRGKYVLDLCAAPGGKTAQLAAMGAFVTAVDESAKRLEKLRQNMERLGLSVSVEVADARKFTSITQFDAILLDAPCSATGTLRRHPDIAWHRSETQIRSLAELQAEMLGHAAQLLKSGGKIIFSTCSIEPEEGEAHLKRTFERLEFDPILCSELADHRLISPEGFFRSLPQMGMDGFFAARFKKL